MFSTLLAGTVLASTAAATPFDGPTSVDETTAATVDVVPTSRTVGFLPRGLTSFGSVCAGGYVYVLGGYFGTPHDYSIEGQSAAFLRINVHDTRDVRLLADVEPCQSVELVQHGDALIRVSGMHARNKHGEPEDLQSSTVVRRFDPITETWSDLADLPAPRSSHRAVVIGDTLYVAGGWSMLGGKLKPKWADDLLALDLTDPEASWVSIAAPFKARALGAATTDGKLVVVGGITPDRGISSDVRIYDPATGAWSEGPAFPDWGFGVTAVECQGRVLASGRSGDVHALDLTSGAWSKVAQLTTGRIFHELVASEDGAVYALGGITGMDTSGRIRAVERVDLQDGPDGSGIERFTLPAPCHMRDAFGLAAKGRSLYVFGGTSNATSDSTATELVDEAWRLDLGSLAWTPIDTMPAGRQTIAAALSADGEKLFAIGGFGAEGETAKTQATSVAYEFEFDDWVEGPALPASRSAFGIARRGDSLWVFGGAGAEEKLAIDVVRWDGTADAFANTDVALPRARHTFAGVTVGDRYMLIGGEGEGSAPVIEVDVYDFETGEWSEAARPGKPRVGANCVELDGLVYLIGGVSPNPSGEHVANPSIEVYDPSADRWDVLVADLRLDASRARALTVDGKILVLAMNRDGDSHANILMIDPARVRRAD